MLEASDFDAIDHIFPFLGGIADKFCEDKTFADTTKLFASFVELLDVVFERHRDPHWIDPGINDVRQRIITSKNLVQKFSGIIRHPKCEGNKGICLTLSCISLNTIERRDICMAELSNVYIAKVLECMPGNLPSETLCDRWRPKKGWQFKRAMSDKCTSWVTECGAFVKKENTV